MPKRSRNSPSSFAYRPLNPDLKEIRLLYFSNTTRAWDDSSIPLRAALKTVSLVSDPGLQYYAVSYCWGKDPALRRIVINQQQASVPESAIEALRAVCHPTYGKQDMPVWIDAICINQSDAHERSRQVAMMAELYASAREVLVYIGEEDESSERGWKAVHQLADAVACGLDIREGFFQDTSGWISLIKFFDSSYFVRLWAVQEIVLSRSATVWRGKYLVPWVTATAIYGVVRRLHNARVVFDAYRSGMRGLLGLLMVLHLQQILMEVKMQTVFSIGNVFESAEPRDKIYACLGLLGRDVQMRDLWHLVEPDYTLPVADVYLRATIAAMRDSQALDVLKFAQENDPRRSYTEPEERSMELLNVPSWVPRYDLVGPGVSPANTFPDTHFRISFDIDETTDRILILQGVTVCSVGWVNAAIPPQFFLKTSRDGLNMFGHCFGSLWETHHCLRLDDSNLIAQVAWTHLMLNGTSGRKKRYNKDDSTIVADFAAFMLLCKSCENGLLERLLYEAGAAAGDANNFVKHFMRDTYNRHFATTSTGHCAMVPLYTKPGDLICIIAGCDAPLVLRSKSPHGDKPDDQVFQLIGTAYVEGIMDGEYVDQLLKEDRVEDEMRTFRLI